MPTVVTNEQIQRKGHQFARLLDAKGVPVNGVVALLLPNVPEFLYCFRGITWSGRVCTPINRNLSASDIRYITVNSEASAIVAHVDYAESAQAAAGHIPPNARFSVGGEIPGFRRFDEIASYDDRELEEARAGGLMLYTSGTTGRPKGVKIRSLMEAPTEPPCLSSRSSMETISIFLKGDDIGTHLVAGPLYHSAPLCYCEGAALLGARIVFMEKWDAEEFLRLVESERVTSTFLVPTHFVRLLKLPAAVRKKYDLSSLELLYHAAAPVTREVKQQMIDWVGPILYEFYGGTEGASLAINSEEWLAHPGSVGKPIFGLEVHILDENGQECPPGVVGDIYFYNPRQTFEYKDDPEKTASAYRGKMFTIGDIGYVDDEGYLYLCDRKADIIISGGVNIYPAEIEGVLLQHPAVLDCCVVGIFDEEWGEKLLAVVIPKSTQADKEAFKETLTEHCRERLGGHQVPRLFVFTDTLPRTEAGKIQRREVRDTYRKLLSSRN